MRWWVTLFFLRKQQHTVSGEQKLLGCVSLLLKRLQMEDSKDLVAPFLITHPLVFSDVKDNVVLPGDILLT